MSNQRPKKIKVDSGVATIIAACIAGAVALLVHFTSPNTISDESSNNSEKKPSENIFNTSEIEIILTTDSLENDEYPSNPDFPPEPNPPASSTPPTTTSPTITTPKPPETSTTPKITTQTSTAPKSTTPTTTTPKSTTPKSTTPKSTTPKSTPSTKATTNSSVPSEPTLKTGKTFECENGRIKLFSSYSGEVHINRDYLEKNSIGKILYGERQEISAWSIELLYNDMPQFFINIELSPNNQYQCTALCSGINDTTLSNFEGEFNIKFSENGDLLIDFKFDSLPFNLYDSTNMYIYNGTSDIDIDFPDRALYNSCAVVRRCEGGIIGIYNDYSGVAYIYKDYLDEHPIGGIVDGSRIDGWSININANDQYFFIFLIPVDNSTNHEYELESFTLYCNDITTNEYTKYEYIGDISTKIVEDGHLMIEFSINNMPFNLQTINYFNASFFTQS